MEARYTDPTFDDRYLELPLPEVAQDFIAAFDAEHGPCPGPFEFILDIPDPEED
jgi:hypothetical protein